MAGRDTDMRSWADLLHNSSQLLHSYTPSAPLPPIQVLTSPRTMSADCFFDVQMLHNILHCVLGLVYVLDCACALT